MLHRHVANVFLFYVSGMLALALDDFTLLVVDIETRRIVRKFAGHRSNITDMVGAGELTQLI